MKWILRIFLFLLVLALALFVVSLFIPKIKKASATATIEAPNPIVYDQVNELKNWENWSAWHKMDPDSKYDYSIPSAGEGAWYNWNGPKNGKGKMTITKALPGQSISTALDFDGHGTATANFTFDTEGNRTKITWDFESNVGMNPIAKFFTMGMEKEVEASYKKSLETLSEVSFKKYQEFKAMEEKMRALKDTLQPIQIAPSTSAAPAATAPAPATH